jgi:nucleotide-binding universal stress UspA family protein
MITQTPWTRILFATDGSVGSRAAEMAVASLAARQNGSATDILVLHVAESGRWAGETERDARELVGGVVADLAALGLAARGDVRHAASGRISEAIVKAAGEYRPELIVMGSRGRSDVGGLFLGSVSHGVLAAVDCPVLLVRGGRRSAARHKRILLAVAGNEDAEAIVSATARIAQPDSDVLVLHLQRPTELEEANYDLVDDVVARLREQHVHARGMVRDVRDETAPDIALRAKRFGADLIVMGSRRLSHLQAFLQRSISQEVGALTDRPVLVGPRRTRSKPDERAP